MAPPDFPRFNTVVVDKMLKPITLAGVSFFAVTVLQNYRQLGISFNCTFSLVFTKLCSKNTFSKPLKTLRDLKEWGFFK